MLPTLGWTLLSQDALRRAETQLRDDVQSVRDEMGFLLIHQAYADYFFPGTSVLQTRLRYALIVPWIYQKVAAGTKAGQFRAAIQKEEVQLAGRLRQAGESGIIGGRSYPKPTSQPANMVYWTALRAWGILRSRFDGSFPSRFETMRILGRQQSSSRLKDADSQPLEVVESVFAGLPKPPKVWRNTNRPFTLTLDDGRTPGEKTEASFLRQQLIGVVRPNTRNKPALLSVLAEAGLPMESITEPWVKPVLAIVDATERAKLLRAQQVAALTAIGRGVYGALVEVMLESRDNQPISGEYLMRLGQVIDEHRENAVALDIRALRTDISRLPGYLHDVLEETQRWLFEHPNDVMDLYEPYHAAEVRRKGRRARLSDTLYGRQRRQESAPPTAYPLSYRWSNVQRLLKDLETADG